MKASLPRLLAFLIVALVTVALTATATAGKPGVAMTRSPALEAAVAVAINDLRRGHGLVPLRVNLHLASAATEHSRAMAQGGFFEHASVDGSPFWKRVQRHYVAESFPYWAVGENLVWSSPDLDAGTAIKLWMESPEHRANLLAKRWREVGLSAIQAQAAPGTFTGLDVTIVTADFGVRR